MAPTARRSSRIKAIASTAPKKPAPEKANTSKKAAPKKSTTTKVKSGKVTKKTSPKKSSPAKKTSPKKPAAKKTTTCSGAAAKKPCASKEKPCASKEKPCASKDKPCASKDKPCASKAKASPAKNEPSSPAKTTCGKSCDHDHENEKSFPEKVGKVLVEKARNTIGMIVPALGAGKVRCVREAGKNRLMIVTWMSVEDAELILSLLACLCGINEDELLLTNVRGSSVG